jgi:hypothetical protein
MSARFKLVDNANSDPMLLGLHFQQPARVLALVKRTSGRPSPKRKMSERPDRRGLEPAAGTCHDAHGGNGARHDQLTNAALAAWFGARRCTASKRKPRACRGFRSTEERLVS